MPAFEEVGKVIQAARKKLGLSQEQFASAIGVTLSRLQKWESGVNEPRFTVQEFRRLRSLNREVYDALLSGFVLAPPRFWPDSNRQTVPRAPNHQESRPQSKTKRY